MSITLEYLANLCDAELVSGNPTTEILSAADIKSAKPGQITQFTNAKYSHYLKDSLASACFVGMSFTVSDAPSSMALLRSQDPELSFIKALHYLHPEHGVGTGVADTAVVAGSAQLADSVFVGAYAIIGQNTRINEHSEILPGAYIGNHVTIGKHCRIHPYAVIYDHTVIGDYVIIHAGAVIGADGFGYKFRNYQHIKVPQVGNVVIGDYVEIGANTCVDRGALGSTHIGEGSKIDNLVQIGHNNQIGKHVIMCGQVGVSGSCHIDDYATLAGSVGIADHVKIGQAAIIMARSGVAGDVEAGAHMFGSPAKDKRTAYKEQIALSKLPDMVKTLKQLEEKISALENTLKNNSST